MTNLFLHIAELVPKLHGWCTVQKAHNLAAIVCALRPVTAVEIGVYGGRSLIPIAMAMKYLGKGLVIGIDPWDAKASAEGQQGEHRDWWGSKCDHDIVFRQFSEAVQKTGTQNCIKVLRKRSDEVEPPPGVQLLHLDGNHGDQAYIDIRRFAPSVVVGGMVVLDDLTWPGGAVSRSEEYLLGHGFVQLSKTYTKPVGGDDDWATYQRVK